MSKFRTVIPVSVKAILEKLPHGSYVHDIKLTPEKDGVEVVWDNDLIIARFQQIDFPPECLDGDLPADVVRVIGAPVEPAPANPPETSGVGNNPVAPRAEKPKRKRG